MGRIFSIIMLTATCMIALIGFAGCSVDDAASTVTDNTCPALPRPVAGMPMVVNEDSAPDRIELIYFHKQNPCHCMAVVGDNIRYAVENNFKEEIASGKVRLTMVVSDDPSNAELVKQYDAMLFTLFIKEIRGSKELFYPVNDIWNMTGDENRDRLVDFTTRTIKDILEGKS